MKNVQVIDSSEDCPYNVYAVDEHVYSEIFEDSATVAFLEDIRSRRGAPRTLEIIRMIESGLSERKSIVGIHGLLFIGLLERKKYFPTMNYHEVSNGP